MKKNILIGVAVCIIALILGTILVKKKSQENIVTRFEWIEMLGEQYGTTEYTNESPYFKDVDSDNPYFPYVQAAVEWGVLDAFPIFSGDNYATGRFIVLSAMRTIGENKFKIYFETDDAITDDTYIEFAVKHELIKKEKLEKNFSKEECEQILENVKNLYFGELWRDDYLDITYQSETTEILPEDILMSNTDCSEIVVTDDLINSFEVGNVIVVEQKNTKLKVARKIDEIHPDGTLLLSTVELEEVVESLTLSDITTLTFEDIVNSYEPENLDATNTLQNQHIGWGTVDAAVFSGSVSQGYKFSVSTEGEGETRHLEVKVTDHATGISYALPIRDAVEDDNDYSAEIDIDQIYIAGQAIYTIPRGFEYAEVALDVHAKASAAIHAKEDKKILLFKAPVPLGGGIFGVDVKIYLVLSIDGSISFEAELPAEVSVCYEKGKGIKNFEHHFSVKEPVVKVNCEAGAMLRLEPSFVVLGRDIMDLEADLGITANAEMVTHPDAQICADISVAFPVISLSVCGDDDANTIIGNLGLSAEWEIISSDNAPIQLGFHYEILPDNTTQFVDACTYGEKENLGNDNQEKEVLEETVKEETVSSESGTDFAGYFNYELPIAFCMNSPMEDYGDYYLVNGHLWIEYCIDCYDFNKMKEGESFTLQDKQFIKGKAFRPEGFSEDIYEVYCVDDDCIYYIYSGLYYDYGSRFQIDYYTLCYDIPDPDSPYEEMRPVSNKFGEQELKIEKDALVTSVGECGPIIEEVCEYDPNETELERFYRDEEQRKAALKRYGHTVEECIKDEILLDDYWKFGKNSNLYGGYASKVFYITFDESGMVDTMIMDSFG